MQAGEICSRKVSTVRSDASVLEAARRMRDGGVDSLVVVGRNGPVEGILTERDIVVRWAVDERPATTPVADVMTKGMVAVSDHTTVEDALDVMAGRGLPRLVVTDDDGHLIGVLAVDDIMEFLGRETGAVTRILHRAIHA